VAQAAILGFHVVLFVVPKGNWGKWFPENYPVFIWLIYIANESIIVENMVILSEVVSSTRKSILIKAYLFYALFAGGISVINALLEPFTSAFVKVSTKWVPSPLDS